MITFPLSMRPTGSPCIGRGGGSIVAWDGQTHPPVRAPLGRILNSNTFIRACQRQPATASAREKDCGPVPITNAIRNHRRISRIRDAAADGRSRSWGTYFRCASMERAHRQAGPFGPPTHDVPEAHPSAQGRGEHRDISSSSDGAGAIDPAPAPNRASSIQPG